MKKVFSYCRVSSKEQEEGASLEAQKEANEKYALAHGLVIVEEFREVESASQGSRKIFSAMIQKLNPTISGIIFHDVDRSTRSIVDLARLDGIRKNGYDLHYSRENKKIESQGDILMMHFKGILATNFSENLSQEVKKGLYKRLEDGLAVVGKPPLGYLTQGGGVRPIDELTAPFIKEAFRLYASGKYSLDMLADKMYSLGLRTRSGGKLEKEKMSRLLKNKFYIGLIEVKGRVFTGRHESLVPVSLFEKVQAQMSKRTSPKTQKNEYKFLHILTCGLCGKTLRTMTAKHRYHYYACRNKACQMSTIKESEVEQLILDELEKIRFNSEEITSMVEIVRESKKSLVISLQEREKAITLQLNNTKAKLSSLIDMQLTNPLPEDTFNQKRNQLVSEEQKQKSQLAELQNNESKELKGFEELIKLLQDPVYAFHKANAWNKAQLVQRIMKNITFDPQGFYFDWETPFDLLAKRNNLRAEVNQSV